MRARILIVEDNALLALDLARTIQTAGFDVTGPALTAASALNLIEREGCDAAVLDVNLGNETSEGVALELRKLNTPFLVVSACFSDQLPGALRDAPVFTKPLLPNLLIAGIVSCIQHRRRPIPASAGGELGAKCRVP